MKIQKEFEQIQRRKCQEKGCSNKAASIFKTKYLCKECWARINPTSSDKRSYYIRYSRYSKTFLKKDDIKWKKKKKLKI